MDDTARWVLTNFQQVSVAGLLAFALIALSRGWVVLGTTHRECRDDLARLKAEVARYVAEDAVEKESLKREIDLLRQQSSTPRRSR